MAFEILEQGMIARQPTTGPDAVAACSRCVVTGDGDLVCSFAVQEALGGNDFKQVIVRSKRRGRDVVEAGLSLAPSARRIRPHRFDQPGAGRDVFHLRHTHTH